jgi:hypothetical protein
MPRLDFRPERDGFHFANGFTNRMGPITTYGRCGGMVYAALDHYLTGVPIPSVGGADFAASSGVPADGTPLADYLYRRSTSSILNWSARRFLTWQAFRSRQDCLARSVREFDLLKHRIDRGLLTPLGLVAAAGGPGASHQVLAYGYDHDAEGRPVVYLWDNNRPDVECVLRADLQLGTICEYDATADPGLTAPVHRWKGWFVHDHYDLSSPQRPPSHEGDAREATVGSGHLDGQRLGDQDA